MKDSANLKLVREVIAELNQEITLLREVYEGVRGVRRYSGVDQKLMNKKHKEMEDAIDQVMMYDGGYYGDITD